MIRAGKCHKDHFHYLGGELEAERGRILGRERHQGLSRSSLGLLMPPQSPEGHLSRFSTSFTFSHWESKMFILKTGKQWIRWVWLPASHLFPGQFRDLVGRWGATKGRTSALMKAFYQQTRGQFRNCFQEVPLTEAVGEGGYCCTRAPQFPPLLKRSGKEDN